MSAGNDDPTTWLRPDEHALGSELSNDECWAMLASAPFGRLAVRVGLDIDVLPVNFNVNDRSIYVRSAPGGKLAEIAAEPVVAFEADGHDGTTYWSVLVHGTAERLSDDAVIEASGVLDLTTATTSVKSNFVRISPRAISGRRYQVAVG